MRSPAFLYHLNQCCRCGRTFLHSIQHAASLSQLWWKGSVVSALLALGNGCAVHYYDARTGVEHVWGIGHLRMKAAPVTDDIDAVVSGRSLAGIGIGAGREDYYFTAGWDYRRRIVVGTNAALSLEWPNADFFNVRVGTNPPFLTPGHNNSIPTSE